MTSMICQECGHNHSKVMGTYTAKKRDYIGRRRMCLQCKHRWTTIEIIVPGIASPSGLYDEINYNLFLWSKE